MDYLPLIIYVLMIELAVVVNTVGYFRFNHRRDDPFSHQGKTKIASN